MTRLGSIGDYLIAPLSAHGVGHLFGVPGDFVLGFYDLLARSDQHVVNTCAWTRATPRPPCGG